MEFLKISKISSLERPPLHETLGVKIAFVIVFLDACDNVSDRAIDQAT